MLRPTYRSSVHKPKHTITFRKIALAIRSELLDRSAKFDAHDGPRRRKQSVGICAISLHDVQPIETEALNPHENLTGSSYWRANIIVDEQSVGVSCSTSDADGPHRRGRNSIKGDPDLGAASCWGLTIPS
jgi:hypothetical protein